MTYLIEHDIRMPVRLRGGAGKGELEWPEAFTGREVCGEDDLLDFPVGCAVDIEVARQPSA
jgi:hypothetical protein